MNKTEFVRELTRLNVENYSNRISIEKLEDFWINVLYQKYVSGIPTIIILESMYLSSILVTPLK